MNRGREANFELMGIVLMLFVVCEHIMNHSNCLDSIGTNKYYVANIFKSFCVVAVNVYVLRSGYFGIKLRWEKLIKIDLRVCLYTWIGLAAAIIVGIHHFSLVADAKMFFPVLTKQYWYVTVYFALCILSPFINKVLETTNRKQLKSFLIVGFFMFYVVSSFCFVINGGQLVSDAGYGIVNFIYLYCLGYYIKNYYKDKKKVSTYLFLYILSCLILIGVNMAMTVIMGFYFDSLMSYNTVFVLSGSVALFMFFKNLKVKYNKIISRLGSKTLPVYILHTNLFWGGYLFKDLFMVNDFDSLHLLIGGVLISVIVYLGFALLDIVIDYVALPFEKKICEIILYSKDKMSRGLQ